MRFAFLQYRRFCKKNPSTKSLFSTTQEPVDDGSSSPPGAKKPPGSPSGSFAISRLLQEPHFAKRRFSQGAHVVRLERLIRLVRFVPPPYAPRAPTRQSERTNAARGTRDEARGSTKRRGGNVTGPDEFSGPRKVFARRFLFGRNQEDMRSRHSVECRTVRSSALGAQAVRRALMRAETLPRSARPFTRGFTRAMTLPMAAMPVRPTAAVASSMIAAISSSVSA